MALKPCRECEKKVSTEASSCPNCGAPHPTHKAQKITEPKFSYKFGDVKIENDEYKLIKINENDTYARCFKSFCKKRYKILTIPKSKIGKEICNSCGNKLEKVSKKQALDYFANKDYNLKQAKSSEESNNIKKINDASKSKAKYFFNLINGLEGLPITFWGYFIGGNAFINVLALGAQGEKDLLIFLILIKIAWFIISGLGVFRAADIYKNIKIEKRQDYNYATAAKIAVVVLALSLLGSLT